MIRYKKLEGKEMQNQGKTKGQDRFTVFFPFFPPLHIIASRSAEPEVFDETFKVTGVLHILTIVELAGLSFPLTPAVLNSSRCHLLGQRQTQSPLVFAEMLPPASVTFGSSPY